MLYPDHIAIIPDGNRTWAKNHNLSTYQWHLEWTNNMINLAEYIFENTTIKSFTTWWLSTENLKNRTKDELDYLFNLYESFILKFKNKLLKNKINFNWIWSKEWLSDSFVDFLKKTIFEINSDNNIKNLNIAINYWWKDEIIRWIKEIYKKWIDIETINEENFWNHLDFWNQPNLDFLIRTKWKLAKRLSGFMLWQIWYAELYFSDKLFPDFNIDELKKTLDWFDQISTDRNFWK
jgi:undecaprenyl diphosphate synthase